MKKIMGFLLILLFICCCGCSQQQKSDSEQKAIPLAVDSLKYAKGFSIERFDNYTRIQVFNALDENDWYITYYLCNDDEIVIPEDGIKVLIPLSSIAATSCTHFEFIQLIGEIDCITGICEANRIYNNDILNEIKKGFIVDLGSAFNLNFEKLLGLKPDAVMMTGFEQQNEMNSRIDRSGIPVLYNNEWMENDLLGRAEWIKFVAAFFDKSTIADSIFNLIENKYNAVCSLTKNVEYKPTIMSGNDFRGTWYVPGGKSNIAELYRNGGGEYVFDNDDHTGSIPLTFETALKKFSDVDIWLWCSYNSLTELKAANERHTLFKAYKNGQIYNNMNRTTPSGGNDFWESAVARPDILLQDVIKALHPDLLPDHELFYLKKLE